ncbi:exodeoxyribonuclease VII large subunit [Rhodohalobacter sp. 614A]|uniref:exodeoxyribonuclease VII large subunit n=1 Tax=Rhodohalobacter sp. 614A TaxID=2908649 RepID=UPI001F29C491|nr:exodeoxyribonuclease VII large subunit [Rhodohalobacter sp. 614A]
MKNQIPFAFDVPSVSELTDQIKNILESNFRDILVEGEISNVNQSRNGHYYFTVKDDSAQLPCVIWRSTASRLDVELQDGQQVVLGGDIQVYPPHGRYQMIVTLVQQAGIGRLQKKFEELKKKLQDEGLFDDSIKKPLPPFPFRVGVITSSTGAAFHDIQSTFQQRWPVATLYLHHASVQGMQAAGELVKALEYFERQENPVDLIIIGRGGGSLEDLWPFNEEIVARAIHKCAIPIVSAVGHEVDFSISDFVADARAATPTQAVIISTPDINELRFQIEDDVKTLESLIAQKIQYYRDYVDRLAHSHALLVVQERLTIQRNRVDSLRERMRSRFRQMVLERESTLQYSMNQLEQQSPKNSIQNYSRLIESLNEKMKNRSEKVLNDKTSRYKDAFAKLREINPKAPLEKGFSRILQDGKWIRTQTTFDPKKELQIEWKDGLVRLPKYSESTDS